MAQGSIPTNGGDGNNNKNCNNKDANQLPHLYMVVGAMVKDDSVAMVEVKGLVMDNTTIGLKGENQC